MIDKIVPPGEPPAAAQPATERPCEHQWVMQMLMVPTGTGSITKPGSIRCCLCGSFKLQNQVGIIQPPAAQPATEDWQPIETAPTCGKWIVIPGPKLARFVVAEPCYWITSHYEQIAPTHWMPLPAPPSLQPPAAVVSPTQPIRCPRCGGFLPGNTSGITDMCDCLYPMPRAVAGTSLPQRERGLYRKFDVHRTDGTDAPEQKHDGCNYFVLDVTHDSHALPALQAYAESCKDDYPALAADVAELAGSAVVSPREEPKQEPK